MANRGIAEQDLHVLLTNRSVTDIHEQGGRSWVPPGETRMRVEDDRSAAGSGGKYPIRYRGDGTCAVHLPCVMNREAKGQH